MTLISSQEIEQYRTQLAAFPGAMTALTVIEDCEGDLEDAAMTLAIRIGQEPQMDNSEWLDALTRKWRAVICQKEFRVDLNQGSITSVIEFLAFSELLPATLATPVLIYAVKLGINDFCELLDAQSEIVDRN